MLRSFPFITSENKIFFLKSMNSCLILWKRCLWYTLYKCIPICSRTKPAFSLILLFLSINLAINENSVFQYFSEKFLEFFVTQTEASKVLNGFPHVLKFLSTKYLFCCYFFIIPFGKSNKDWDK